MRMATTDRGPRGGRTGLRPRRGAAALLPAALLAAALAAPGEAQDAPPARPDATTAATGAASAPSGATSSSTGAASAPSGATAAATGADWAQNGATAAVSGAAAGVSSELPAAVQTALAAARDYAFAFDFPGYYALLDYVRTARHAPGQGRPPLVIDDWTALAERPGELRGLAVTIEGVVGRNKSYRHVQRPALGPVWQLELTGTRPQPIACTVVCTENCDDVPLGAEIRITAYFVMMRQYYPRLGAAPQAAALLVAAGPTAVATRAPRPADALPGGWGGLLAALAAGLALAGLLLRRAARATRVAPPAPTAANPAPHSLADDLAAWAEAEARSRPDSPPAPRE